MNGYFQIIPDEKGTKLKIYAPTDSGNPVSTKELSMYLEKNKVTFDLKAINDAVLKSATEDQLILLSLNKTSTISESSFIYSSEDNMKVIARFYPPSEGGRLYDFEGVMSELRLSKVTYGYDENEINSFLENKKYCTDYILARGTPPIEGHDAVIEYKFETSRKIRPKLNEDGTVDFHNLDLVTHCKKGDILAVLTPEYRGECGKDVLGNIIKPHDVKKLKLDYGLNIEINEDKTVIKSMVDGHVSLYGRKVFVSDVYEVENVDNSVGNINYEGSVKINGNVNTNFIVKCKGNIIVKGIVEGAILEADGDIILDRGINGMGKGVLKAGGNIIAKFLENCTASAGGYVETESIMHSTVQAKTEVNVVSRKGFISGSIVHATNKIKVKTLGSLMGSDTEVYVGMDPVIINRYNELQKENENAQKNLKIMLPVIEATKQKIVSGAKFSAEQINSFKALAENVKNLQQKIIENSDEMESLKEQMDSSTDAKVEATGDVLPGTKINISDVTMIIKDKVTYCRFVKERGTVVRKTL